MLVGTPNRAPWLIGRLKPAYHCNGLVTSSRCRVYVLSVEAHWFSMHYFVRLSGELRGQFQVVQWASEDQVNVDGYLR